MITQETFATATLLESWKANGLAWKLYEIPRGALDCDEAGNAPADESRPAHYLVGLDSGNVRRVEETLDRAYDRWNGPANADCLSEDDRRQLGALTTRNDAGRHFTALYSGEWLSRMEALGYAEISRPIHRATGIPYDSQYWSVEVAAEVADFFDSEGNLYTD